MPAPPRRTASEVGDAPPGALLIDEEGSRPRRLAVVAIALAATALIGAAVVFLSRPAEPGAEDAREAFLAESPAPGASEPVLAEALRPEIPSGIGGSPYKGDVLIGAVVGADGRVTRAEVVHSLDPALDAVARRAVERARFHPAMEGGVAVEGRTVVPVHFEPF